MRAVFPNEGGMRSAAIAEQRPLAPDSKESATLPPPWEEEIELRPRHLPNAISAMVLFLCRLTAAVVQLRLVDRFWGGGYTGLNALSNQVLLYVTLLELGLSQSAITLLYEPILRRNFPRASGMVAALRRDVRRLTALGAIVIFPALAAYAHFVHGAVPYRTVTATLACVAAAGLLQLSAIHFQAYLNAAEQLDKVNYTLAAGYIFKSIAGLWLAIHWHNYLLLPAAIAVLTLGEIASLRFAFHRIFPQFRPSAAREESRDLRSRAKYVLIQRISGLAYYQSDFIILSLTVGLAAVRNYAKFQYVSAALLSAVGLVAGSLTTSIARAQMRHHAQNRRRQYVLAQLAMSIIGAILMLAFWFTARTVVTLAFGLDLSVSRQVVILFGVALFLNVIKSVDDVFLMAKGAFEVGYWIPALEVPIYVVTGVLLSRRIGFAGILIASIATNIVVSIGLKGIVMASPVFDSGRAQWYGNRFLSMGKALLASAPLACVYMLADRFLHPTLLRFAATNLLALACMLAGIRWTVLNHETRHAPES